MIRWTSKWELYSFKNWFSNTACIKVWTFCCPFACCGFRCKVFWSVYSGSNTYPSFLPLSRSWLKLLCLKPEQACLHDKHKGLDPWRTKVVRTLFLKFPMLILYGSYLRNTCSFSIAACSESPLVVGTFTLNPNLVVDRHKMWNAHKMNMVLVWIESTLLSGFS